MAFVQDDAGSVGDGGTIAYGLNVGSGVLLVATFAIPLRTVSVVGITDTRGNTWALADRMQGVTADQSAEVWFAHCPTGGANTLTVDLSGATTAQVTVAEFDGFANGAAKDQSNENEALAGNVSTFSHGSITTTQATGVAVTAGRSTTTYTINALGDGFTSLTNGTRGFYSYKIQSATETVDGDVDFSADEQAVGVIANFYDTGGGGGGTSRVRIWRMGTLGVH
jgi:hypothetical protein